MLVQFIHLCNSVLSPTFRRTYARGIRLYKYHTSDTVTDRDILESGKFIAEHNREAKSVWIKIITESYIDFHNGNYFYSICELKPRSSQSHLVTKIEGRPTIPLEECCCK
jgi:hypothetical protein